MLQGDGTISIFFAVMTILMLSVYASFYIAMSLQASQSAIKAAVAVFVGSTLGVFCTFRELDVAVSVAASVVGVAIVCMIPCPHLKRIGSVAVNRDGKKYRAVRCHLLAWTFAILSLLIQLAGLGTWSTFNVLMASVFSLLSWGGGFVVAAITDSVLMEMQIVSRLRRRAAGNDRKARVLSKNADAPVLSKNSDEPSGR